MSIKCPQIYIYIMYSRYIYIYKYPEISSSIHGTAPQWLPCLQWLLHLGNPTQPPKNAAPQRRSSWHQKCQKHGPAFCSQHAPSWDGGKLEKKRIWWSHFWKFGEFLIFPKCWMGWRVRRGDSSYIMSYTSKSSLITVTHVDFLWIHSSRFHPIPSQKNTSFCTPQILFLTPQILRCHLKIDFWKRSFWT